MLEPAVDVDLAGRGCAQVVLDALPVGKGRVELRHPELVDRHPVGAGGGRSAEHVEPVQRQHTGDLGEQTGAIAAGDAQQVDLALVDVLDVHRAVGLDEPSKMCEARRVGRGRGHLPTVQHGAGDQHQFLDERLFPTRPGGRAGGSAVGLGERGKQVERLFVAHRLGSQRRRARVAQVASRCGLGQQQVVLDQRPKCSDVVVGQTHARCHRVDQIHAHLGVIARIPLAEVVHQRAQQQQVGTTDGAYVLGGVGDGLQQVPVDGVGVERIALRQAAHRAPLGQVAAEQPVSLECLHRVHQRLAGPEQADERTQRALGPHLAGWHTAAGQQAQRPATQRIAGVCGSSGVAEHERRLVDLGVGGHVGLVVDHHHPGCQRGHHIRAADSPATGPDETIDASPEPLGRPLDRVRRAGEVQHQRIGVGEAHRFGHPVLVLQQQHVAGAAGGTVQLAARCQQQLGRAAEVVEGILEGRCHLGAVDT